MSNTICGDSYLESEGHMIPETNFDEHILKINEDDLVSEWKKQVFLCQGWGDTEAKHLKRRDISRFNLEQIYAEISTDIRKNPMNYNVDKITESVVEQTTLIQERYVTAKKELIEVEFQLHTVQVVRASIETRKKALEIIAQLWTMQYYATPKEPRQIQNQRIGGIENDIKRNLNK